MKKNENSVSTTFEETVVKKTAIEYHHDSEVSPGQIEQDLDSPKNPANRRNIVFRRIVKLVILLVVGFFIFIIYKYWHSHSKKILYKVMKMVDRLVNQNTWYSNSVLFLIEFLHCLVLIPGAITLEIALAYFMRDF